MFITLKSFLANNQTLSTQIENAVQFNWNVSITLLIITFLVWNIDFTCFKFSILDHTIVTGVQSTYKVLLDKRLAYLLEAKGDYIKLL